MVYIYTRGLPVNGEPFLVEIIKTLYNMLRIAVQSKGRLYDETMALLQE